MPENKGSVSVNILDDIRHLSRSLSLVVLESITAQNGQRPIFFSLFNTFLTNALSPSAEWHRFGTCLWRHGFGKSAIAYEFAARGASVA